MYKFLSNNREELIERCKAKVELRVTHRPSSAQLENGIPLFLDQLTRTLKAEDDGEARESIRISGNSGGDSDALSVIGVSAAAHGKVLLELGFTIDQVVHDYGDLCQAITDLAFERDAPFSIDQFRTLNRCLDNAIADAVTEFSKQHDATVALQNSVEENQRLGFLVHELRNHLSTANLAFSALESGKLAIGGSTSAVVKHSLVSMASLLNQAISEVRGISNTTEHGVFSVAAFVADAKVSALLYAGTSGCTLSVFVVDPLLAVSGNRILLSAALMNLLQNAFKFTRAHTEITLSVRSVNDRVMIEVQDRCGGLSDGVRATLFKPFAQASMDRSGLGLGLAIARRSVEADGGELNVTNLPGVGCVFTMSLPRCILA